MSELQVESGIVERLLGSFIELECAIENAKNTLAKNSKVPEQVFERLNSYTTIISRQRDLAHTLGEHMRKGEVHEVVRHVSLINGLSSMIIDDARLILASFNGDEEVFDDAGNDSMNYC